MANEQKKNEQKIDERKETGQKDEQKDQQKDLQENILAYRLLEAKLDGLVKQRDLVASKMLELQSTLESISELIKSKEDLLFPIGAEAFTFGKISDEKKIIIGIGMNVAVEKDVEEAKKILEQRKNELGQALDKIQKEMHDVMRGLENLGPKIQRMMGGPQSESESEGSEDRSEDMGSYQPQFDGMGY